MTVREVLREGVSVLVGSTVLAGSPTLSLDASLLLAFCLGIRREILLASLSDEITTEKLLTYRSLIGRRAEGRPVAYLLGHKEFYGRTFRTDGRALIPRPDTELLVEAALAAQVATASQAALAATGSPAVAAPATGAAVDAEAAPKATAKARFRVHELCTGSGAVAVTLAAERPDWDVSASDISGDALSLAAENARAILGRDLVLTRSDLLESVAGPFDLILANPPYVPSGETGELLAGGWGEPRIALDGGPDGLDLYPRLIGQALSSLRDGGLLYVEADGSQSGTVQALFRSAGFVDVVVMRDLAGIARVTGGRKPWKS